eukprot:1503926-Pyramimonas_sp.AAC.1
MLELWETRPFVDFVQSSNKARQGVQIKFQKSSKPKAPILTPSPTRPHGAHSRGHPSSAPRNHVCTAMYKLTDLAKNSRSPRQPARKTTANTTYQKHPRATGREQQYEAELARTTWATREIARTMTT